MRSDDPYHDGEKVVQHRAGEQVVAERNGRAINTSIMPGALKFIAQQRMAVLGSVDANANVWASVAFGEAGFVSALDQRTVLIDLHNAGSHPDDPFWTNIANDPRVGILLIELSSRRRLRINGNVERVGQNNLRLDVEEAYPNCPKYIQRRHIQAGTPASDSQIVPGARSGRELEVEQRGLISNADTFFVASADADGGVDASHRGGQRGFVRVLDDLTLRVPDYAGNSMFNTLGNFESNPHAGLVFVDFNSRSVLQLTGRSTIRWDLSEQPDQPTGGTQRYWDFAVTRWVDAELTHLSGSEFLDYWDGHPQRNAISRAGITGDHHEQDATR